MPRELPLERRLANLVADLRGLPEDTSRSRDRPVKELAPLIEHLLVKHQIGRSTPEEALRERWTAIVGEANAAFSHPARILAGGGLLVLVSHAVVRSELQLHQEEILQRIRAVPGCGKVTHLTIRNG